MAARYGIRMDESDPTLAIVGLNEIVLERSVEDVCGQLRERIVEFEASAQKLETRAGQVFACGVKEAVAEVRRELNGEIHAAALRCRELLQRVDAPCRPAELLRWAALGIVFGLILFLCGVWVGRLTALGWSQAGFW